MEKFKELKVWHKTHNLVLEVYGITKNFPKEEIYCLVNQMRRAAISVSANIAEGSKRKTSKDRGHFIVIAETSLEELKYYLLLAADLSYISSEESEKLLEQSREIGRMLTGFYNSL